MSMFRYLAMPFYELTLDILLPYVANHDMKRLLSLVACREGDCPIYPVTGYLSAYSAAVMNRADSLVQAFFFLP